MRKKLFLVKDVKAQCFKEPMFFDSLADAERAFGASACEPKSDYHNFAEDFILYYCGELNLETGIFIPNEAPMSISFAVDLSKYHREFYAALAKQSAA